MGDLGKLIDSNGTARFVQDTTVVSEDVRLARTGIDGWTHRETAILACPSLCFLQCVFIACARSITAYVVG